MATRSFIAIYDPQDPSIINGIYCHYDGYVSGVGAMLLKHYNNQFLADMLVYNGDIKILAAKISDCDMSYTVKNPFCQYVSEKELLEEAEDQGIEYVYLYTNSEWKVYRVLDRNKWESVSDILQETKQYA